MEGYARDQLRPQPWIVGEIGIDEPCATSTCWCTTIADGEPGVGRLSGEPWLPVPEQKPETIDLRIV